MKIRTLSKEEHQSTRPLYEEVFPEDSQSFVDYYYQEKTKDNEIYVVEEEGGIQAMLHLNPYVLLVNGQEEMTHYIVAVATRSAFRKRGYMAALLKESLKEMYDRGEPFTFLMPAAEAIYLPHDFRTVYEQQHRYVREKESAIQDAVQGLIVREVSEEDAPAIARLAEDFLREHCQVYAKRTGAYYHRLMKEYASDGGSLLLYEKEGELIDCRPLVPDAEEGEKPKIMVRVVHLKRMLELLKTTAQIDVCFQVMDRIIPENTKCLVLKGTPEEGIAISEGTQKDAEGVITAAALASLIFGSETIEETAGEEGVQMSAHMRSELGKLVPLSKIYLNEIV